MSLSAAECSNAMQEICTTTGGFLLTGMALLHLLFTYNIDHRGHTHNTTLQKP